MNNKKIIFSLSLLVFVAVLSVSGVNSKTKPYYSGDAIIYNGNLIVGSTNMGVAELFKLQGKNLIKAAEIKSLATSQSGDKDDFYDLALSEESNKLFIYLVDGRYIYKYDISDLAQPSLVDKIKDNSWDYFLAIDKIGDKIITMGAKGVKVWNKDEQIINSYSLTNKKHPYNINYNDNSDYIIDVDNNVLKIFNKNSRSFVSQTAIQSEEDHNRKSFNDLALGRLYLADDQALKMYDLNGSLITSFKHISTRGYDVDGQADKNYLYFTDGYGVVKFNKDNLKPLAWTYTTNLAVNNGWAMGLKVLNQNHKDKLVVFNNSSIIVLDENLKLISYIVATEADKQPQEELFLNLDKNRAAANSLISLHGGGYAVREELIITFANQVYSAKTDNIGRFTKIITVPSVLPVKTDIKVVGKYSGQSYSIGFAIE